MELLGHHDGRLQRAAAGRGARGSALQDAAVQALSRTTYVLRRLRRGGRAGSPSPTAARRGAGELGGGRVVHLASAAAAGPARSRSTRWTARSTPTTSPRPATPGAAPTSRCTRWPWARPASRTAWRPSPSSAKEGFQVAFVGDVVGTGSSRKSACNSVLWAIGEDIPCVPNKRHGRRDHRRRHRPDLLQHRPGLRRAADQGRRTRLKTGDVIVIDTKKGEITRRGRARCSPPSRIGPNTLRDEFRAGGRIPLIIGRAVTDRARKALGLAAHRRLHPAGQPETEGRDRATRWPRRWSGRPAASPGVLPGRTASRR